MTAHLAAWANCTCTDVRDDRDFETTCPCHGGRLLGTTTMPDEATRGHNCTIAAMASDHKECP